MSVIETLRLRLEHLVLDDAPFILQLVNEPSWLQFIGDKGVRNLDDARGYLSNGPLAMYERHGFGLYRVTLKSTGEAIGLCGLLKRDTLEHVDIGYALFPAYWGQGYAAEATGATRDYARDTLRLPRLLAICSPDNARSIALLQKLGLTYEDTREFTPGVPSVVYGADF